MSQSVTRRAALTKFGGFAGLPLALVAVVSVRSQTYNLTDLGALGGTNSAANAINQSGQVVGVAQASPLKKATVQVCTLGYCAKITYYYYEDHAFIWTPTTRNGSTGAMADLGALGGDNSSLATGINPNGQVTGDSHKLGHSSSSFLYSAGRMTDLGSLGGGSSEALGINSSQQVVGASETSSNAWHAFLWQNGAMTDLGTLPGGTRSVATALSDMGQVVGYCDVTPAPDTNDPPTHAFLWQNGTMSDIGGLPDFPSSFAFAVNTNGQVVGYAAYSYYNPYNGEHAFLLAVSPSGGVISRTDLGTLPGYDPATFNSIAYGINNRGEVVGRAYQTNDHAFVWDAGHGMRDLNSLVPPGSPELSSATAINDAGQIVGVASDAGGGWHAFLLTPQPQIQLLAPLRLPNGQFRFSFTGEAGRSYTIQASTDLLDWASMTNFAGATGTNQFTDGAAAGLNRRFYRVVTP
jgi:probable HAF family extracellular repeat protein